MNLLRYKPYLADVAKEMGINNSIGALDKNTLYRMVVSFGSPDVLIPMLRRYAGELGYPCATENEIQRMAGDASTILIFEALSLFYGVLINVEDPNFVQALLRTKVDAITDDVRLPFPIMEFSFPDGVDMGDGVMVNGALVIDMEHYDIQKEFKKYGIIVDRPDRDERDNRPLAQIAVLSRMRGKNGEDIDVCIHRFCKNQIVGDYKEYMPHAQTAFIRKQATLIMSLLLYLQCFEKNQALQNTGHCPKMPQGVPAVLAKIAKHHPSYHIRDLLAMGKAYEHERANLGGTHASPIVHWRTWVLRSLRHERFKRNADGSIHVIWIKPCQISVKDDEDRVTGERRIRAHDTTLLPPSEKLPEEGIPA